MGVTPLGGTTERMPSEANFSAQPEVPLQVEQATSSLVIPETQAQGTSAESPGYTYVTPAGNTYHAKTREEAIGACSVLAGMSSEARNALFNVIDRSQRDQSNKRQAESYKPETPKQTEPAVKHNSEKSAGEAKIQAVESIASEVKTNTVTAVEATRQRAQMLEAALLEAVASQEYKLAGIMSSESQPAGLKPKEAVAKRAHTEKRAKYGAIQPVHSASSVELVAHGQQEYESAETNFTEAPDKPLEPAIESRTAETAVKLPYMHPTVEGEQALEPRVQGSTTRRAYREQLVIDTFNAVVDEGESSYVALTVDSGADELLHDQPDHELLGSDQTEVEESIAVIGEAASDTDQTVTVEWTEVLDNDTEQIYEVFTEVMQLLAALGGEQQTIEPENSQSVSDNESQGRGELQLVEAVPGIAVTVAERLVVLEPESREAVASTVADMLQIKQAIDILEAEDGNGSEALQAKQVELHELVVVLFEQLGIVEYEEEDIEKFIAVLFRPDFLPPQTEINVTMSADLEREGTREAKRRLPQIINSMISNKDKIHGFLGKLSIYSVIGSGSKIQTLAY